MTHNGRLFAVIMLSVFCACGVLDKGQGIFIARKSPTYTPLAETGSLQAVSYSSVVVPWVKYEYGRPQLAYLEEEGKQVKQGEVVAKLETSGILKVLDSKKPELAIAEAELNELRVNQGTELSRLDGELKQAEASLSLAIIDTERVAFESEAKKNISRQELLQARISFEKAKQKIEMTKIVQAEDIKIQQAKIRRIEADIRAAEETFKQFTIRAPSDGMIEYNMDRRSREKVKIGDQLWSGRAIIGLPDLSKMKVLTAVNETDIDKIEMGQSVEVRLDAFPKIPFSGKIIKIAQVCRMLNNNKKMKVFDVEVLLDVTDRILRPGMTVRCEFLSEYAEVLVNQDCVKRDDTGEYVTVVSGEERKRIPVRTGRKTGDFVPVRGDIRAGDRVVLY